MVIIVKEMEENPVLSVLLAVVVENITNLHQPLNISNR
jgi:hypothetical protein